ncbi:hypothetical protein D3C75_955050 [compost metagenome]
MNKPPALAPNNTHSGQIAQVCNISGIARLDNSSASAQPLNSVRRDMRSASAPIGSCSSASPTTTVLTMNRAISVLKPCCRQYTGNKVRIIASNAANRAIAQAMTGKRRQKPIRSSKVTLHASALGAPSRPNSTSGANSSKPAPIQKPRSSSEPITPRSNGPASWLRA